MPTRITWHESRWRANDAKLEAARREEQTEKRREEQTEKQRGANREDQGEKRREEQTKLANASG
jgi:hypothetical protein